MRSELRLGNIVKVHWEDEHTWSALDFCEGVEFEPIPLTEEWLKSTDIHGTCFGSELCFTILVGGNKIYLEQYGEGWIELDHIKYRHQAQNLYFALTGTEITIKQ
jgi:hypothetical protein